MPSTDPDLAYLAGFIDGEGSISISKEVLRLSAGQITDVPLLLLQKRFGGKIRLIEKSPPHRSLFHWTIDSVTVRDALYELLPYLRVKSDAALVGISFQNTKWRRGSMRLTEDEREIRSDITKTLRYLNRERTYA